MSKIDKIIEAHGQPTDGWAGPDACLEVSLLEYNMIWRETDGHVRFIYTAPFWDGGEDDVFTDWAEYPSDTKAEKEWDWALTDGFFSALGVTRGEFIAIPLPHQVECLVNYYGILEIFGESYFPTRTTFDADE